MTQIDIFDRLRIDPGQRTLGQLLQDREAAAYEIRRLRADIERLQAIRAPRRDEDETDKLQTKVMHAKMLIRLTDVSKVVSASRSTIYKWVAEGRFPAPVRVSERAIRWRVDEIRAWQEAL